MNILVHYRAAGDVKTLCGGTGLTTITHEAVTCEPCRTSGCAAAPASPPRPSTVLEEAAAVVEKDRETQYGSPEDSFATIAVLWNGYLDRRGILRKVSPEVEAGATFRMNSRDVAMLMVLMKVARDAQKPKRDNLVDIAGYARCAERAS